jgi:hypothetical protein
MVLCRHEHSGEKQHSPIRKNVTKKKEEANHPRAMNTKPRRVLRDICIGTGPTETAQLRGGFHHLRVKPHRLVELCFGGHSREMSAGHFTNRGLDQPQQVGGNELLERIHGLRTIGGCGLVACV